MVGAWDATAGVAEAEPSADLKEGFRKSILNSGNRFQHPTKERQRQNHHRQSHCMPDCLPASLPASHSLPICLSILSLYVSIHLPAYGCLLLSLCPPICICLLACLLYLCLCRSIYLSVSVCRTLYVKLSFRPVFLSVCQK